MQSRLMNLKKSDTTRRKYSQTMRESIITKHKYKLGDEGVELFFNL